jgi:hypothetical protein
MLTDAAFPFVGLNARIAGNAFRILGLPATAQLADIPTAIHLLQPTDTSRSVSTPWDAPWLGLIPRSVADTSDALNRLTDPDQRLRERLFWFTGKQTSRELALLAGPTVVPLSDAHDAALLMLAQALVFDAVLADERRWVCALQAWQAVCHSATFWQALTAVELESDFYPKASPASIATLRDDALVLVTLHLQQAFEFMGDQVDAGISRRGLALLAQSGLTPVPIPPAGRLYGIGNTVASFPNPLREQTPFITPPVIPERKSQGNPAIIKFHGTPRGEREHGNHGHPRNPVAGNAEQPSVDSSVERLAEQVATTIALLQDAHDLASTPDDTAVERVRQTIVEQFEHACMDFVCAQLPVAMNGVAPSDRRHATPYSSFWRQYARYVKPKMQQFQQAIDQDGAYVERVRGATALCLHTVVAKSTGADAPALADLVWNTACQLYPEPSAQRIRLAQALRKPEAPVAAPRDRAPKIYWSERRLQYLRRTGVVVVALLVLVCAYSAVLRSSWYVQIMGTRLQHDGERVLHLQNAVQRATQDVTALEARLAQRRHVVESFEAKGRLGLYYDESSYQQAVKAYLAEVPSYNQLAAKRNALAEECQRTNAAYNRTIAQYNALIARKGAEGQQHAVLPIQPRQF